MKTIGVSGYKRKSKAELIKAIDKCTSLSQLFALIQHEGIVMQMHSQSGASNLTPKTLGPKEIIDKKDTPFERLKAEVRKAVVNGGERQTGVLKNNSSNIPKKEKKIPTKVPQKKKYY